MNIEEEWHKNRENTEPRKKTLRTANISDRRGRKYDVNDLINVRKEL
jgi:hypothetical protein